MAAASGLPQQLDGVVRVPDEEALRALLARGLDLGCKPTVAREPDGGFSVPVIGTGEVFDALRAEGLHVTVREQAQPHRDVGAGDRFADGTAVPRGFGTKVGRRPAGR
jgi:hypothetical protein